MFSKKATKIDEIFPYVLSVKSTVKISSICFGLFRKHDFYFVTALVKGGKTDV